jgi:hypothetical protein
MELMRISSSLFAILFVMASSLTASSVFAQGFNSLVQQPRTLAMGGAGVGIADDEYALFMNPAGIAAQEERSFRLIGLSLETSGDTYSVFGSSVSALKNFNTSSLNSLMGKDIYLRAGLTPLIQLPHFEIAYVLDAQGAITEFNQANPYFQFGDMITQGVQAGTGWTIKSGRHPVDEWRIGVAAKVLWRRGGYYDIGTAGFLAATSQGKSYIDGLTGGYGMGVGLDSGVQYVYHIDKKTDAFAGASITDIGNTKFSDPHASEIPMNPSIGVGYKKTYDLMKLSIDADLRNLNQSTAFCNKTHVGADLAIPLFDFMVGLSQLYPTFGVSVDVWILKVSALSYGDELGVDYDQVPSRRYLLQVDFKLPI